MQFQNPRGSKELIIRAQFGLGLTQKTLGALIGCSRRTIIRYQSHGAVLTPATWEKLARAAHAKDRALAADLAAKAGHTLVSLGLEAPPPPPAPPAPPPRPAPSAEHLADSIVCAAAEAMQATPQAARPAVVAAFERAVALGLSAEEVLRTMKPESAKATRERKPPRA
jgi:hypothetical protein